MTHLLECLVIEPPTGDEVLTEVKESGEVKVVLRPVVEVPALSDISLALKVGGITLDNPEFRATMRAASIEPDNEYAAVTMRVPHEAGAAATATIVVRD